MALSICCVKPEARAETPATIGINQLFQVELVDTNMLDTNKGTSRYFGLLLELTLVQYSVTALSKGDSLLR